MIVAGLMSGSSMDGLDIALVSFSVDGSYQWIDGTTTPLTSLMANRLRDYENLSTTSYLELERDFSDFLAAAFTDYVATQKVKPTLVGVHGHTIIHLPTEKLTRQIAHGGILAASIGVDVVTDFRMQDIVSGGVGTPLVAILERQLLSGYDYYLNLGGIANITHLESKAISAYDICPCNQLLNHYSHLLADMPYDTGGNIARKGTYQEAIVEKLDTLPYWLLAQPKAIDNRWIREVCLPLIKATGSAEDVLHTLCCWIAKKIGKEITGRQQTTMLVTGGGVYNDFLFEQIKKETAAKACTAQLGPEYITDYKEAILMAYMAYLRVTNKPNVLAAVTGAEIDTCAGAYYKGKI